jgi:YggT family protein
MDLIGFIKQSVNILADLLSALIFIRVLLSWFPGQSNAVSRFIHDCTEPILGGIRALIPSFGGMDFSPIIAYFAIELLRYFLNQVL